MAQSYKRDRRGRFARVGGLRAKIRGKLIGPKLTREQRIAKGREKSHQRLLKKGYEVSNQYTYKGDSRGRRRADGKYEHSVKEYRKK